MSLRIDRMREHRKDRSTKARSTRRGVVAVTLLIAGCAPSDVVCSAEPLSRVVLYDKGELIGGWELTLEVLEDTSGRLSPGPIGMPEEVWIPLPEESFLFVRGSEGALRALFAVEAHVDGYRDGETTCVARPGSDEPVEWWRRGLMRVDWSQNLLATHPALFPEDAGLRVEPLAWFASEDDVERLVPRFERNEAGELVRFSLAVRYYVLDAACPDCPGSELTVRFTFARAA